MLIVIPENIDLNDFTKEIGSSECIKIFHFKASNPQLTGIRSNVKDRKKTVDSLNKFVKSIELLAAFIFIRIYQKERIKMIVLIKRLITL